MSDKKIFFRFVIPSILSFALSGIYGIVDGIFVGNRVGDSGISAINIVFPVVAFMQAVGTGIGMGGAVNFSLSRAKNNDAEARKFTATATWNLLTVSVILTTVIYFFADPLLKALGAGGQIFDYGKEYLQVVALGTVLQVFATGFVPFIRNLGGSVFAMLAMVAGFATNIVLDYLFVFVIDKGVTGAAYATVIAQGITTVMNILYLLRKKQLTFRLPFREIGRKFVSIIKIGITPFGLVMSSQVTIIVINRLSVMYGGDPAIAVYAVISYIFCIIYLILQGVGDGAQPLMSRYYGEDKTKQLKSTLKYSLILALAISVLCCVIMFFTRYSLGKLLGASADTTTETGNVVPIFLLSMPFVTISRVNTSYFYATERSVFSYILTYAEPLLILAAMFVLPRFFGGQIMIWWSVAIMQIVTALVAVMLKIISDRKQAGERTPTAGQ